MFEFETHIKSLQEKLQLLIKNQQQLVRENQRLTADLEKATGMVHQKEEMLRNLQQQLDGIQVSSASGYSDQEKAALEKRINTYLKEIDHCLTLLK
jgi:chromosome segregation ATPase